MTDDTPQPADHAAGMGACECVCVLRHPDRLGACAGTAVTTVWLGKDIRLCLPCTGPLTGADPFLAADTWWDGLEEETCGPSYG